MSLPVLPRLTAATVAPAASDELGNHHTRVAFPRRLDRSLYRASFTALSGCATRWRARRIRPNLLPLCEVVQIGTQPVGSPAVGDISGPGIRTSQLCVPQSRIGSNLYGGLPRIPMAWRQRWCAPLERDEACLQIRCQVGILERESNGREACRIAARLDEANEATSAINACLVLPAPHEVAVAGKIGSGILGLARSSHQRGLRSQVAGFGLGRRRGHFSTRFRPGQCHIVENRGLANESAASGRRARPAAPMAVDHSPSNAKRLGVRLAVYQRRTSILACPTAQTHIKPVALKAGLPSIGWHSFRHTVSAWGKEAGLELEDVKTLSRHENIANHLGDLWGFGPRSEATDSAKADQSRQSAGSRDNSVKGRDPYLSHEPFRNCLQPTERMVPQVGLEST